MSFAERLQGERRRTVESILLVHERPQIPLHEQVIDQRFGPNDREPDNAAMRAGHRSLETLSCAHAFERIEQVLCILRHGGQHTVSLAHAGPHTRQCLRNLFYLFRIIVMFVSRHAAPSTGPLYSAALWVSRETRVTSRAQCPVLSEFQRLPLAHRPMTDTHATKPDVPLWFGSGRLQKLPRRLQPPVRVVADAVRGALHWLRNPLEPLRPARLGATWRWFADLKRDIARRRREPGLTVGIQVNALWEPLTGIGWYVYRLLDQLSQEPNLRLRLYGPSMFIHDQDDPPVVTLPSGPAIEWVAYRMPPTLSLTPHWMARLLRLVEPRLIAADRNMVLFAPNYIAPRHFAHSRAPLVAAVHDLTVRKLPWTMLEVTRRALETDLDRTMTRARAIVTLSDTVRSEILEDPRIDPGSVHTIYLSSHLERAAERPRAELPDGVPARFLLHVGTVEPRKNVSVLLEAWRLLQQHSGEVPPLVLCGHGGWGQDDLHRQMADAAEQGWLHHVGYVPDPVLRCLYDTADAVVCPSMYEGFGLPLVEAMTAGTPLVCSDIPVFREVAQDAAIYAPPDDPDAWATQIRTLLDSPGLSQRLRDSGRTRVTTFSWQRTAAQTLEVWRQASRTSSPTELP